MIELTLPYPPTVNSYKRIGRLTTTKSGKIYQPRVNTEYTKRFYYEVWMKVRLLGERGVMSLGSAPVSVELDVYPPDNRKRDIDNIIKPCLDSLQNAHMFHDDFQVARLVVTRCATIDQGQIIVRLKRYE